MPNDEQPQRTDEARGTQLLNAVERILSDDADLIALVQRHMDRLPPKPGEAEGDWRRRVAKALVSEFSNRSALSGGAAALPALVPGIGSVIAVVGGALADMALTLKFECELSLCLSQLYGFDISKPRERELAFLLASVSTFDVKSHGNVLVDLAQAQGTAVWNYTPRQVSKLLATVLGRLALLAVSKSFVRAVPLVGIVVGASANKVLTSRVGDRCTEQLDARRNERDAVKDAGPKVQAKVKSKVKAKVSKPASRPKPSTRRASSGSRGRA